MKFIKSNNLYKGLDAVLTSTLGAKSGFWQMAKSICSVRTSNYDRVRFLVNLLYMIFPGAEIPSKEFLISSENLPFKKSKIQPLSYGHGSTVYLFEEENNQNVVKVLRKSLNRKASVLYEYAKIYQKYYDRVSQWYDRHNLILPGSYIILNSPLCSFSAVACIQNYVKDEMRDFFKDFSDDELLMLMKEHKSLEKQIIYFARKTIDLYYNMGVCTDIVGEKNWVIIKEGNLMRLNLIDYGYYELDKLRYGKDPSIKAIEQHITRLEGLLTKAA